MSRIVNFIDFISPVSVDPVFLGEVVIPDGTWVTEGTLTTHFPHDRDHRESGKRGVDFTEEVFIIANDLTKGMVERSTKSIVLKRPFGASDIVASSECLWTSPNPFAVLVKQMFRRPDDLHASCDLKIYWSKQVYKGEAECLIPVPILPVTIGFGANGEEQRWVNLAELTKAVGFDEPRAITAGFLAHRVFEPDSRQPTFVYAKDIAALKSGPTELFPSVKLSSDAQQTSFLAATHKDEEDVPADNVWVAEPSAEKVLRIVALGIRYSSELVPARII